VNFADFKAVSEAIDKKLFSITKDTKKHKLIRTTIANFLVFVKRFSV